MNVINKKIILFAYYLSCISYVLFSVYDNEAYALEFWQSHNPDSTQVVDHSQWQTVLEEYVVDDHESGINYVDYEALSDERWGLLKSYLTALTSIDPRLLNKPEQFAYWVNLYNALTLDLILENYPVKSITKLGEKFFAFGPWDDPITSVMGQTLTLNDIEHQILRVHWDDYRVHFAVNCASLGCPNLQKKAFTAENTDALLDEAAQDYLLHPRGLRFDKNELVLSSIFKWYKEDFGVDESELLSTLSEYLPDDLAEKVQNHKGSIDYDYDWSLNDVPN